MTPVSYIFAAKVKYFDEVNEFTTTLLLAANSFPDAMMKLSDYFGEDSIISATIDCVSDDYAILEVTDPIYEDVKECR